MDADTLTPEIVWAHARIIVGFSRDYSRKTRWDVLRQWADYTDRQPVIPNRVIGAHYGVAYDQSMNGDFRYLVGAEVTELHEKTAEDLATVTLAEGNHVVLSRFAPLQTLPGLYDRLFSDWLPRSDYRQRPGPVFERYPSDTRNSDRAMAFEIWVPVIERA